jgi:hypothetical protein
MCIYPSLYPFVDHLSIYPHGNLDTPTRDMQSPAGRSHTACSTHPRWRWQHAHTHAARTRGRTVAAAQVRRPQRDAGRGHVSGLGARLCRGSPHTSAPGLAHVCGGTGPQPRLDRPTSAPGPAHICAGTGPHLRRDRPTSARDTPPQESGGVTTVELVRALDTGDGTQAKSPGPDVADAAMPSIAL